MPAPRSSPPAKPKSSSATTNAAPATKAPATKASAARGGAKATATSARKAASRTATQAKAGATRTQTAARSGAVKAAQAARKDGARAGARAAGSATASTAKAVRTGAKGTATAAREGAKQTATTAKAAVTKTRHAGGSANGLSHLADQLAKGEIKPGDVVITTRERIKATLDDAASHGRLTRKHANELVTELMRRGHQHSDDVIDDVEQLFGRGRDKLESATKRARKKEPVDRLVRGADKARRTVGVGPSFPILGYDDLNARQVQERLKDLSRPELRKVRDYERKHANRKSVMQPIEKTLA
jgi:hypothetical protein